MDNQKLKKFLTENTKRTAVLRIPGIILILGSVIMAFMPDLYFFMSAWRRLLPASYTY